MKEYLRKTAKTKRSEVCSDELSEKILFNLISMPEYKLAKNIMYYYSAGSEVNTHSLAESDRTKNWFLPKMRSGNTLDVCPYSGAENLITQKFGILEPDSEPIKDISILDMVIIPCLCADKNGFRLGYGKGYYDRFLKDVPQNCKKVILTYSQLLFDSVSPEKHDIRCDFVVTENQIVKINL